MKTLTFLSAGLLFATTVACNNDPVEGKAQAQASAPVQEAAAAPKGAETLVIDFNESAGTVGWVGAKVTGKHEGGFKAFRGTVSLVSEDIEKSQVTVTIDTTTLFADHPKLQGHLAGPDFFNVEKFPQAVFASTKIVAGGADGASHTVTGNLELHGEKKSVSFPATISVTGKTVSLDAEFGINRRDFGLVYPGMPDDLIKDEVLIKLHLKPTAS